jgi:hypothetical protein
MQDREPFDLPPDAVPAPIQVNPEPTREELERAMPALTRLAQIVQRIQVRIDAEEAANNIADSFPDPASEQ